MNEVMKNEIIKGATEALVYLRGKKANGSACKTHSCVNPYLRVRV